MNRTLLRHVLCSLLLIALLANAIAKPKSAEHLAQVEGSDIDEDPWEEVREHTATQPELEEPAADVLLEIPEQPTSASMKSAVQSNLWSSLRLRKFGLELWVLVFCIVYIINIFIGKRTNDAIAAAWANEFCRNNGIFDRNFALMGTGESRAPLLRLSASEYKLYCTGRRFCKFVEVTLKLKGRQDLFSLLIGLVYPLDDQLDVEVYMKESNMPQIVLAVAGKKLMKAMLKEDAGEDDVRRLTRKIEVSKERLPNWPSDKLVVYAEHSSLLYDVMSPNIGDHIFGQSTLAHGSLFRMLHFTSEQSYGPEDQRAVLRFSFTVPSSDRMQDLGGLLQAVPFFIDMLGNYQLSPDMKKRAEKLRQDVGKQDAKEKSKGKEDLIEGRRLAKRAEEAERIKRMTPEQREKYEARRAKIENGRAQKRFVRKG